VFGAGLLLEAGALADRGWSVDALETPERVARDPELYASFDSRPGCRVLAELGTARSRYHLIVVTHVLEFIEDPVKRHRLLSGLGRRLSNDGLLILSLRGWSDVRAARVLKPRGEGFVTGLRSWVRGFTTAEALDLVSGSGLEVVGGPRTTRSSRPEQVRLVCRKPRKSGSR
jgi:hypothetical protein